MLQALGWGNGTGTNVTVESQPPSDTLNPDGVVALSVIVPARDAAGVLAEQLEALAAQRWSCTWEVVVAVDASSADETVDIAGGYADRGLRLRVVNAPASGGPGLSRNVGAAAAQGAAFAFCDADDVVAPGWVAAMGEALRHHEFVTGPLELDRLNPSWIVESRGRAFTERQPVFEGVFPYASSCNLAIRRSLFERFGGFDPTWRVGEDLEFSLRLWLSGVALHFEPGAVVHYRYRPTLGSTYHQARSYGRVRPVLGEQLRKVGHRSLGRSAGLRNWAWLIRHLGLLGAQSGRAKWLWVAGQRIGNLEGSLRVRRPYL